MAFFYHILGLALMFLGSAIASEVLPDYEIPSVPVSLLAAIIAGPIEESIFFGIPFYLFGNVYAVLGMGAFWSILHILNTEILDVNNLAYGGFLFSVPHIFFSLRTWICGKGWFVITFHSAWNVVFLTSYCMAGLRECLVFDTQQPITTDLSIILIAASLITIVYLLYKKQKNALKIKYLIIAPIVVFVAAQIYLAITNPEVFFPTI